MRTLAGGILQPKAAPISSHTSIAIMSVNTVHTKETLDVFDNLKSMIICTHGPTSALTSLC